MTDDSNILWEKKMIFRGSILQPLAHNFYYGCTFDSINNT